MGVESGACGLGPGFRALGAFVWIVNHNPNSVEPVVI